jgi:formylglycine-generating enzyme required for sulfatase activity
MIGTAVQVDGENVIFSERVAAFVMPDHDVTVTGTVTFLPVLPVYTMIHVPGGTVKNGMTWGSSSNYPLPRTIPAFKIGETEVTYELWYAVKEWATSGERGANEYVFAKSGEGSGEDPVTTVSWRDCVVWCNAYSEVTGKTPVYYENAAYTIVLRKSETSDEASGGKGKAEKAYIKAAANGFRLPTDGQWEYAARGGKPSYTVPWNYKYAGSSNIDDVAWYGDNASGTHAVKTKQPNSLGLYDMSGNVWEWCWDKWSAKYADRVGRGGGWSYTAASCSVAIRGSGDPSFDEEDNCAGFRVVRL